MEEDLYVVTAGGLLHDIGKLIQRADSIHKPHSEVGVAFLQELDINMPYKNQILDCLRYHHAEQLQSSSLPAQHPAYIVFEADNIASGADRRENEGDNVKGFDLSKPLETIFTLIGNPDSKEKQFYRPLMLRDDDGIAYPASQAVPVRAGDYARLKTILVDNVKKIDFERENLNSLLQLLEAISSYIPSSTAREEITDISLYDHLKLTAAIGSALYLYLQAHQEKDYKTLLENSINRYRLRKENCFLLVSADISGIQDFIYTISSKGALKSLRARSFYLEIILEHIADEILSALDLTRANLLYSGGGHFYLLLPNTKAARDVVEKAKSHINRWFFRLYRTSLYIEINCYPVSAEVLMNVNQNQEYRENLLGGAFEDLNRLLARGKMRRYLSDDIEQMFLKQLMVFYEEIDMGRECVICRVSSPDLVEEKLEAAEEPQVICRNCRNLRDLGGRLGRIFFQGDRNLIAVTASPDIDVCSLELPGLNGETYYLSLVSMEDAKKNLQIDNQHYHRLYAINDLMTGTAYTTHLWMGNYSKKSSLDEGMIDFKELADASQGIKRLGVLRADVDDLGQIFAKGLEQPGEERYRYIGLSRQSMLSRQMSIFFKRNINFIAAKGKFDYLNWKEQDIQRNMVIVYAGGDDLFAVGAWNDIINFAVDLRQSFRRFTCDRLHFSAGIGFFKPGFPISQMASLTAELEEAAKNMNGKDAVALFGLDYSITGKKDDRTGPQVPHLYKWDDFINHVLGEKLAFLNRYLTTDNEERNKIRLGNSAIYKWLNLLENLTEEDDRINLARLAYQLSRLEPPSNSSEEKKKAYEELRRALYLWAGDECARRELITALHLYVYQHRKEKEDEV